ncbi:class I SAM-dependent methyltransferase [Streptomyces sp. TRM 70361]|uniref:SAM-dependent methyltransferase n=1 Tax=Streptomyces sp. TRM 70361 TaxID=3116553 RepID=UPI002E7B5056|nr:class I SAM-dependent methyltransferase [Streptomyces sp. TRM 70361]MEE1939647.1 class I SAM-dependent methyltransferase [Streptomyces sp. TRM 70361]
MKGWAEGLELIELVRAAHRAGWLERLRDDMSAAELASVTGVSAEQVSNVLAVLVSAGVVQDGEKSFRLSPAFDALVAGASGVDVSTVLGGVELARAQVAQAVRPTGQQRRPDGEQALRLARDWGVRATPGARQLYGMLYETLGDYRDRLEQGGPLLDVGSGVGGALLTTLTLFDGLRAVGVETVPEVAAELGRRARDAGVADRVDVRTADARVLRDESIFTVSYWAQVFFPAEARADTLAAIFRALRPDGLLLVQELFPPESGPEEPSTRTRLDRLFYRQQHIAWGMSAEDLAAEGHAAGFRDTRIVASPLGRLVVMRKPAG